MIVSDHILMWSSAEWVNELTRYQVPREETSIDLIIVNWSIQLMQKVVCIFLMHSKKKKKKKKERKKVADELECFLKGNSTTDLIKFQKKE